MPSDRFAKTGLEHLLEALEQRFVSDEKGRLSASAGDGVLPRFVLGRAAEGCVWRFSAELPLELVRSVAKLAGREKGCAIDGESTAPPERLVMIGRLLRTGQDLPIPRRDLISHEGSTVGEFWTLD